MCQPDHHAVAGLYPDKTLDPNSYSPPWWLKNSHLQTLWASLCRPVPADMPPSVTLEIERYGGHVGFIAARKNHGYGYWLEQHISCYLQQYLT